MNFAWGHEFFHKTIMTTVVIAYAEAMVDEWKKWISRENTNCGKNVKV